MITELNREFYEGTELLTSSLVENMTYKQLSIIVIMLFEKIVLKYNLDVDTYMEEIIESAEALIDSDNVLCA